jgi:hypothetical protein
MMSVIARQLDDWLQERNQKSAAQNSQRLKWQPRKSTFPPTPASACCAAPLQRGEDHARSKGRNVIIDKSYGAPRTTKDSVTVAKDIGSGSRRRMFAARQLGASTTSVSPKGNCDEQF